VDSGQGGIPDLAAMLDGYEFVDARMALIRAADGWPIVHGEVTLDSAGPARIRTWWYAEETFLDRRLPGRLVAGLLRGEPQDLDGLKVMTPAPMPGCTFQRLAGQAEWSHLTTPWPRTEWSISSSDQMPNRQDRLLVGDGPAFLNFEAAYSSFFYSEPPSNLASQQRLWRIIRPDRRAWLHRIIIASDALTIVAKGTQRTGVTVELSSPANRMIPVVQDELCPCPGVFQVHEQVPGLLHYLRLDRMLGGSEDLDAAGAVPGDGKDADLRAVEQAGGEEVQCQDPLRLGPEELRPARAIPARSPVDPGALEDLPDRGWRHRDAGPRELAVDPPVSPRLVLPGQPPSPQGAPATPGPATSRRG
jgi:hypothetical protein